MKRVSRRVSTQTSEYTLDSQSRQDESGQCRDFMNDRRRGQIYAWLVSRHLYKWFIRFRTTVMQDAALPQSDPGRCVTRKLEKRCPLDNGRHVCMPIPTGPATSRLDRLSVEVIIEILLQLNIPSLLVSAVSAVAQCSLSTQYASTPQSSSISPRHC